MATTTRPETQSASARGAGAPAPDQQAGAGQGHAAEPPRPHPVRRLILIGLGCIVAIAAIVWGIKTFLYSRIHATTDDAYVEGHLVPVLAKVGGYATRVNGVENQHVKEGDTLVVIDDAEYRSKLAQARADLAAAQVAVGMRGYTGQALAQVHTAEGQSAATDAQIVAAQANYDKATSDLRRIQTLADKQILSRQQLDAAQATSDAARATLIAAQKQAAAAGASVTNAEAGVRLAAARLAASQAEEVQAALNESYTHITAPVSGQLSRKQVEVGQLVQNGQTLFTVVADTGVWIDANYKETQLNDIRVGQSVEFDVDAYGGRTYHGTVESIAAATGAEFALLPPDNATGNFTKVVQRLTVRIRPTDPPDPVHPLRPGMSVDCHISTGSNDNQKSAAR
jgi:membrane fusion protein (multidrug efflux system)